MKKHNSILFIFIFLIPVSCNNISSNKKQISPSIQTSIDKKYALSGTWIHHNEAGFTLIDIKDSLNVKYYSFLNLEIETKRHVTDKYGYYFSESKVDYNKPPYFSILTSHFRFDYRLIGDTLIEFDKTGDQKRFLRLHNSYE